MADIEVDDVKVTAVATVINPVEVFCADTNGVDSKFVHVIVIAVGVLGNAINGLKLDTVGVTSVGIVAEPPS